MGTTSVDLQNKQDYTGTFAVTILTSLGELPIRNDDIFECYFIEDIYSFSFSGKITFRDRSGLFEFGPITGNEQIKIIYGDKNESIERIFSIFKIDNIEQSNSSRPSTQFSSTIHFCDVSVLTMVNKQFSYAWENLRGSEIIEYILNNFISVNQIDEIETCNESFDCYYSPWWTPKQNILWLLERLSSKKYGTSGYLCYSNTANPSSNSLSYPNYNLKTFESLLTQTNLMTLDNDDNGIYFFEGFGSTSNHHNKILDWKLLGVNQSSMKWLRGGTNYGYDTLKKSFLNNDYKYSEMVDDTTILGDSSSFTNISEPEISHTYTVEDSSDTMKNIFYNKWIKRYNLQNMLEITVRGHESRYAGGMIELIWPSISDNEKFNTNYGGAYLVKSITHYFRRKTPAYLQRMVLVKNGFQSSQVNDLYKASKTNLLDSDMKTFFK